MGITGFITTIRKFFRGIIEQTMRVIFLWFASVILMANILLLFYYLMISANMPGGVALFVIHSITLSPLIILGLLFGGKKHDRLYDKTAKTNKQRSYDALESRARI